MARYYRRRRRWGRRRYLRRRFGAGGGNRKRPSSYAVAYGYTKQFDIIIGKYAPNFANSAYSNIYSNVHLLSLCARVFFASKIEASDVDVLNTAQGALGQDPAANPVDGRYDQVLSGYKAHFYNMVKDLFTGPMRNHAQDDAPAFAFPQGRRVDHFEYRTFQAVPNVGDGAASNLLICLKTQLKDSLLKVTKRNLPFALAISSYLLSFLKNKKRRRKYLNFWKWKSVPRFIFLLAYSVSDVWKDAKYGPSLLNIMKEVDFVRQTASTRRLIQLAQAGVDNAQAELARIQAGINNAVDPDALPLNGALVAGIR